MAPTFVVGAQQKCCPSHRISATIPAMYYASKQSLCFSELIEACHICRCSRTYVHEINNNCIYYATHHGALIRDSITDQGCKLHVQWNRGYLNSRNHGLDTRRRCGRLPTTSCLLFRFPMKPPRTNQVSCQTLCFVYLRIFVSPIRNKFADEIGHVAKSDLCRKSKGAWPDYREASL